MNEFNKFRFHLIDLFIQCIRVYIYIFFLFKEEEVIKNY